MNAWDVHPRLQDSFCAYVHNHDVVITHSLHDVIYCQAAVLMQHTANQWCWPWCNQSVWAHNMSATSKQHCHNQYTINAYACASFTWWVYPVTEKERSRTDQLDCTVFQNSSPACPFCVAPAGSISWLMLEAVMTVGWAALKFAQCPCLKCDWYRTETGNWDVKTLLVSWHCRAALSQSVADSLVAKCSWCCGWHGF